MSTTEAAPASPPLRIAKIGECDSLSGLSRLGYRIEYAVDSKRIFVRVVSNSSSGKFNADAVSLEDVGKCIADIGSQGTFKASAFSNLLPGKSVNTPGFIAALLVAEGLIGRDTTEPRLYVRNDATMWLAEIEKLIVAGVNLVPSPMGHTTGDTTDAAVKVKPGSPKRSKSVASATP
jgi:hypothetical protein